MAVTTEISWAHSTFNPWAGCTKVSPGCTNCYAERDTKRRGFVGWGKGEPRRRTSESNWNQVRRWNKQAQASGEPHRVFCASWSDWLDPEVDPAWLADLLALIAETPHLTWMLLTKRPQLWRERVSRALDMASEDEGPGPDEDGVPRGADPWVQMATRWVAGEPPPNVWLGTTVEDQQRADERIPRLLEIPARVRFLSCEPLLGPVDLTKGYCRRCNPLVSQPHHLQVLGEDRLHWIICGGESGPGARPMHPDWARSLRDQAQAAGAAYHFKQWGELAPVDQPWRQESIAPLEEKEQWLNAAGGQGFHGDEVWRMRRVGKKAAGRLLDGRTWDEFPT